MDWHFDLVSPPLKKTKANTKEETIKKNEKRERLKKGWSALQDSKSSSLPVFEPGKSATPERRPHLNIPRDMDVRETLAEYMKNLSNNQRSYQ